MEILLELNKFNDILFDEKIHQYTSKTKNIKYISATGLVSLVEYFDEYNIAAKQADELNIDINNLLNSWKIEKEYGSDLGSEVHKYAELSWQYKKYSGDILIFDKWKKLGYDMLSDFNLRCKYYDQFYNIISKQFIAIRNELVIYDEYYGVAGMLDLLCYEPSTSNIYIFDWKSSKVIKKENHFNKMKFPLAKYDSCNFYAYSLQLSIYKAIIELNTTLRINKMCIIKISNNENCKTFICEDLTKEAIKLMEYNKNRK